jgi:hypothetical protein
LVKKKAKLASALCWSETTIVDYMLVTSAHLTPKGDSTGGEGVGICFRELRFRRLEPKTHCFWLFLSCSEMVKSSANRRQDSFSLPRAGIDSNELTLGR